MKRLISYILFTLLCPALQAQTLYAVSNEKKIYRINEDFTSTYVSTAGPTEYLINDIAFSTTGEMYGIAYNSIYKIDLLTGAASFIADMPPNFYTSLVCSNDNELYMINSVEKALYKYDLLTNEATNVAYIGYETPGDLTFYRGNLIFQTYNDSGTTYMVKAYNLATGDITDIMCQSFYFQLWGLSNLYGSCEDETILATNPATELLNLNFDTQTVTTLPLQFPADQQIFGLAGTTEYLGSLCESQSLADLNCEQLSLQEILQEKIVFYPNPARDRLYFTDPGAIEKLMIYDATGKLVKTVSEKIISPVEINDLSAGSYILKTIDNQKVTTQKFIKQ